MLVAETGPDSLRACYARSDRADRCREGACSSRIFCILARRTEKDIKVATNKQIGICCYKSILISYLSSMSI